MKPRLIPNLSARAWAGVGRQVGGHGAVGGRRGVGGRALISAGWAGQLVLYDASEVRRCWAPSWRPSFPPIAPVPSGSLAGGVLITFLARAAMCLLAVAVSRKMPVDSTTTSTPSSLHG